MTRTSKRAIRPGFDDLEGRQLLSASVPAASLSTQAGAVPAATSQLRAPGYYYLRNEATGYYLYSSDQQVYERPYNGTNERYELWSLSSKDGYYYLQNVATGYYLYSSDQRVYERPYNGANERYERWSLQSTKP